MLAGLSGLREALLAALDDGEYANVNPAVESIVPPALLVLWSEPWLEQQGKCQMLARPAVTCVGGRIAPEAGVEMLERLVGYTLGRLNKAGFAVERVTSPQAMSFAAIEYLTCQVIIRVVVNTEGEYPWPQLTSS